MAAIFLSQSKDVFSEYLRESIRPLAVRCVESNFVPMQDLPKDIKINSIVENFLVIIRYWIDTDFKQLPEQLTKYFITINS